MVAWDVSLPSIGREAPPGAAKEYFDGFYLSIAEPKVLSVANNIVVLCNDVNNCKSFMLITNDFNEIKFLNMRGLIPAFFFELFGRDMIVRGGTCKRKPASKLA